MSLDLGELLGSVDLIITPFEQKYGRVVGMMSRLGAQAEKTEGSVAPLESGLAGVATSSEAAATGLGSASKALTETGVSASEAAVALRSARDVTTEAGLASSKLTQAMLRQQAAQERLTALQESGTATTRQLAAAQASLIAAEDRVVLAQDRAAKSTGATSHAWQGAAHGMVIAGGLVAAGFLYAAKEAATFDARMALVRTLAKASAEDMTQLREAALTAGRAYGFTANQVADAEAELVKAGISVKDIMGGALRGALTLAAAGQEDVAQATETAAIAMTQFKLKGSDVPHIADLLAAGADKALGSVADLSEALKYGGLAASQAGFSIEDTVGTLAEFAQAGLMGSSAGSTLQQMLRSLQKPSVDAAGLMKRYGIEVYNSNGQMKSSSQLAGELHNKLGTLPPALRDTALATIFGARAVRGANILMRDGATANREWIATVNDQGFAALQAAGKMDSLSGDVTKLKSALQAAFIGVGEGSSGPLRTLVQDITSVVNAWNDLPQPVRNGAEALIAVAGAVSLAGGAAILFIPKWEAMNAAIVSSGRSAITARGALAGLGKGLGVAAAVYGLYVGAKALGDALASNTTPSVNDFTSSLVDLQHAADPSASAIVAYTASLAHLARSDAATFLPQMTKNLDAALASLVTGGHLDTAQADFARISVTMRHAGMSTEQITALFPQFSGALSDSATSAKVAGSGVDQYGNAVTAAAQATKKATDAAKAYSDRLHSLADPLFAMNSALTDLKTKQHAASKAVEKYGADSKQAKQAQEDLASSALDVETSARTLTAAVKDGSVSMSDARKMLRGWVADGLIAKSQAQAIAASWGGLITKARQLAGSSRDAGHAVGFNFGHGMVLGLAETTGAVEAQAAKLAMSAAAAAKYKHQSRSPSRVAMRIGRDFGAGLALGIEGSGQMVAGAAARVATEAASAAQSVLAGAGLPTGTSVTYHQLTRPAKEATALMREVTRANNESADAAKRHAQALSDEARQAHEAAANMRGNTKSAEKAKHAAEVHARALDDEARAAQQAASKIGTANTQNEQALQHLVDVATRLAGQVHSVEQQVSGNLLSSLDLSNAVVNGRVGNLSGFLGAGVTPLRRLSHDEARLRKLHLDPDLIAQIAGAGPTAGLALAQSILSGRSGSIQHLDVLERQARNYAKATGRTVAAAEYGRQSLDELRKLNAGIHAVKQLLESNPHATGRQVADAIDQAFRGAQHRHASRSS